jgi:hypothetical protein
LGLKDIKGKKRKEVDPNVGDFPIGAHGGSLQTRLIIQTLVFLVSNLKQDIHPYNTISFDSQY